MHVILGELRFDEELDLVKLKTATVPRREPGEPNLVLRLQSRPDGFFLDDSDKATIDDDVGSNGLFAATAFGASSHPPTTMSTCVLPAPRAST